MLSVTKKVTPCYILASFDACMRCCLFLQSSACSNRPIAAIILLLDAVIMSWNMQCNTQTQNDLQTLNIICANVKIDQAHTHFVSVSNAAAPCHVAHWLTSIWLTVVSEFLKAWFLVGLSLMMISWYLAGCVNVFDASVCYRYIRGAPLPL